jgi:hypothetical protein
MNELEILIFVKLYNFYIREKRRGNKKKKQWVWKNPKAKIAGI